MNPKARITPQKAIDMARLISFAKDNGFPNATPLYWDRECPEYGQCDLHELIHDYDTDYHVILGIDLGTELIARKDWEDEEMTCPDEVYLREAKPSTKNEEP